MKRFSNFSKLIILFTLTLSAAVFINIEATKMGYSIEKNKKELKEISNENEYLSKEISQNISPKNLETYAYKLGLKYPEVYSIINMEEDIHIKKESNNWLARIFKFNKRA